MVLSKHSAGTNSSNFVIWSIWNLAYRCFGFLKSRLYWINCYFYESSLIFIIRLYSQSPRFIISSHPKTFSYRLFISVSFILYKLLLLWELIDFHISILFVIARHYSQNSRHFISSRPQMFFINCQRFFALLQLSLSKFSELFRNIYI